MFKNLPKFNEQNFIHFITSKTFQNRPFFEDEKCRLILLEELDFYRKKLDFKILGYAIMPDHFHCLIWLDAEKYPKLTISKIIQGIKGHSARSIIEYLSKSSSGRLEPPLQPLGCEQRLASTQKQRLASTQKQRLASTQKQRLASTRGASINEEFIQKISIQKIGSHQRGLKYQIWQKGFYDFNIYTKQKFQEKLNYIHKNPFAAGLRENPINYQWSSYQQIADIDKKSILKIDYLEL